MPSPTAIVLRGVRVHNLQNIDLDVPPRRTTVFTGVSGSGKSSLAFDTLYAEAQRRYLQSFSATTRQYLERLDQPDADRIENLPPAIAVGQRFSARGPRATVGTLTYMAVMTPWKEVPSRSYEPVSAALGTAFLTDFLLPFEVASVVLLAALVGAVIIARKEIKEDSDAVLE